ncbi:unnamed protein product [Ilex paraguariensis]|uniref:Serine carboxypeptidase n=1 Tax=Ilex paraguariensis TaxID=185542 RepID=A0ABC8S0V3_9AQUA
MNMCRVLFIWLLPLLFSISSTTVYAAPARLSVFRKSILRDHDNRFAYDSNEFETHYYTQVVDHFNYRPQSYATFQQWYVINYKYWGGASSNAPIFVYLGAEAPLDYDIGGIFQ